MTHQKTDRLATGHLAAANPSHKLCQIGANGVEENEQAAVFGFVLCHDANF